MEPQLVSVVIPTYNRAKLVERALNSVAEQDYRPIEVILVDDASTDDTPGVVERSRRRLLGLGIALRSIFLSTNGGPAVARNTGLTMTAAALVVFLDSDDLWLPTFLSTVVALLGRYPQTAVAFTGHTGIDVDDRPISGARSIESGDREGRLIRPFELLMRSFPFITSGTLVRRDALDKVGWFDESLPIWQDADLWLRLAKQYDFAYTREPLACYRVHDANITHMRKEWFADQLRVLLRHLPDVRDEPVRSDAVGQIQSAQVLLQEELLRSTGPSEKFDGLLYNDYSPSSARFRLGRLMMHGPEGLWHTYASAIRSAGNVRRRLHEAH